MDWRRLLGGKPQVVLAEKPKRRVMRNEIGAGGVVYMGGNIYSDETNVKLSGTDAVDTYDKMRRTDAQVAALVNTCRLPLLSATWTVERPPEDEQSAKVTDEHLFFARDNLFRRVNFPQFLEHALSCVWAGYAIAEIVWGVENGQVVLRKLAPRLATTIDKWNTDGSGNLLSVEQNVYKDGRYQYITIPREKIALFTYAQEANNYQGMALALDTPIVTPTGYTTMGALKVGDDLYDEQGQVRQVVAVRDFADRPAYRVTFDNCEEIIADENHQWEVLEKGCRRRRVVTTKEMAACLIVPGGKHAMWAIQAAQPLERPAVELPIHPYVFGWWVTDGASEGGRICSKDPETFELLRDCGVSIHAMSLKPPTTKNYRIDGLTTILRESGLQNNKHIPDAYLLGSIEQRTHLLQGLMDGDGSVDKFGRCEFYNTNERIIASVCELLSSLGIKYKVQWVPKPVAGKIPIARIHFRTSLQAFRLPRKIKKQTAPVLQSQRYFVRSVEPVGNIPTRCIETNAPSHLFLCAKCCVPTHNSILRATFKHWTLKDTIYRLDAIRCERYAVGVPKITLPEEFDDDLYDMAESIGKNWKGASQSYVVLPAGMDIQIVTMEGGEALNLMDTIKHHNEEIAKVGLAQFINMGQTETGSRALGDVSTSFFYDAEKGWAKAIAATINRDVLWPLMDMNFPGEVRPTVVASDIGFVALEELISAIKDVGPEYLPPALDIENAVRSRLSLPRKDAEDYEDEQEARQAAVQPATESEDEEYEDETEDEDEIEQTETEQRLAAIAKRIHDAVLTEPAEVQAPEESDFWRPLRESERMVNLRQMAGLLDDTQDRLYRIMVAGRDAWLTVLKEQIPDAIQQGPATIMALSIPDEQTKPVLAQMRPVLAEVYKYGADQVWREVNSQAVSLRQEQMDERDEDALLEALLLLAVTRLAEKTTEAVQTTALGQFRTIGGAAYSLADLDTLMAQVTDTVEQDARLSAALAVSESLNLGRDVGASSFAQKIAICEYSAIMDDGTCENCRQADGKRVLFQSKEYYDISPPLKSKAFGTCQGRHRCRCIWIYLVKE